MSAYATVQDVASALDLPEAARLARDAQAGDTQLSLDRPVAIPGGAIVLVGYRGQASETVTVRASDQTLYLSAGLTMPHPAGSLILDATPFPDVVEAASRMVDQLTYTPAGGWLFADNYTEIDDVKAGREGNLVLCVGHAPVKTVYEVRYQQAPWSPEWSAPVSRVWWDDESYIVRVWLQDFVPALPFSKVRVKVTYAGGYTLDEMPADIRRATAILAARLWKEKDSGYSDVIGNTDFGVLQYTQAAPKDVLAMLQPRKRVGWT